MSLLNLFLLINSQLIHKGSAKMHSWDDFRYFYTVVNTGSFSKAAQMLGVNHSTVSRRIQSLEQSHGVRLLERLQTGYRMTVAGESIYDLVERLNQDTHQASRVLQGQDTTLEGTINLTMPHELFEYLLAEPLKKFAAQNPKIVLNLQVSSGLRNMANREADIAVRLSPAPPEYLIGTKITHIQHAIYSAKGYQQQETTPIVAWSNETSIPQWAIDHTVNPEIVMRVDSLTAMHQAIAENFGIARMPCFLPDKVKCERIKKMPINLPKSQWAVWILSHQDLRNSAKIKACRSFLKSALDEFIPVFSGKA